MDNPTIELNTNRDFIRDIVADDLQSGKHAQAVTRFPPEPNGYLHLGHAKSISVNFGIANETQGRCHLRFDDTNPAKEEQEYVDSIQRDVKWLGFDWGTNLFFASDYFETIYACALELIDKDLAYVESLTADEMREYRGTPTQPGTDSPYRTRSIEENRNLFARMRAGEFADGTHVLRAKIDMKSPNINLRDPALYRIKRAHHHRTGDTWCLYPMYAYAHPISDAIECITHSICTLEFEDQRPFYDWVLDHVTVPSRPRQIEFARLSVTHVLTSKRKLLELVKTGVVAGWDDPRMPTIAGMRRRGYTPKAIRNLCWNTGVTKAGGAVEFQLLEHYVREDLNEVADRKMVVLKPLKVTIENWPTGKVEMVKAENNPEDASAGTRELPFTGSLYIEADDFREDAPKKWFRLAPGAEVRLKHAYYIRCREAVKDAAGNVVELLCTYDPESQGGGTPDGRVIKGTLQWVSIDHAIDTDVRLYEQLFTDESPTGESVPNPESLSVLTGCKAEPSLGESTPGDTFQFMRMGYFCMDPDSTPGHLIFNRTVTLKDSWAKLEKKLAG